MEQKTKLFLDSCDANSTKQALGYYPNLAGQTTNPSLLAKNPRLPKEGLAEDDLWHFYRTELKLIRELLPQGAISAEVNITANSTVEEIKSQVNKILAWDLDLHIKLPIIKNCLTVAQELVKQGVKLNFTLCFSEDQAAVVYQATRGAKIGQVFISPFVGRLDDLGLNGLDLVENIIRLYSGGDGHVQVLAASIRDPYQLQQAMIMGCDCVTLPLSIMQPQYIKAAMDQTIAEELGILAPIIYQNLDLTKDYSEYNLDHSLTNTGLERFASDWQSLIKSVV